VRTAMQQPDMTRFGVDTTRKASRWLTVVLGGVLTLCPEISIHSRETGGPVCQALAGTLEPYSEARVASSGESSCSGVRIVPSPALTPSLKARIESELTAFCGYLARTGFTLDPRPITISFSPRLVDTAYYSAITNRVTVASSLAADTEVMLREMAHAAVWSTVKGEIRLIYASVIPSIHSGLVNYFTCGFHYSPISKGIVCKNTLDVCHISSLENDNKYEQLPRSVVWPQKRDILAQVWGAVFWDMRKSLGEEKTNRLLISTIRSLEALDLQTDFMLGFRKRLMSTAREFDRGRHVPAILAILESRQLPRTAGE
jgi:hypothetical protein